MIIKKLDFAGFVEAFRVAKREDNFSLSGLETLYDFLISFSSESEPYELDVIALCCDFQELTPQDAAGASEEALLGAGGMPCDNGNWIFPTNAI